MLAQLNITKFMNNVSKKWVLACWYLVFHGILVGLNIVSYRTNHRKAQLDGLSIYFIYSIYTTKYNVCMKKIFSHAGEENYKPWNKCTQRISILLLKSNNTV